MNKSALRTFATNARKELLKKIEAKAMKIGITEDNIKKAEIESSDAIFIDGKQLSKEEKIQRDKLIARINQIGFKQVMEEVAYTWFNRFTALRFMEVNDYLPTGVRVLSSSNPNSAEPDMINEALELDLDVNIDKELIYELKLNNKTEELFKYLIIRHCNDLNRYLPFMFETIDDYTEIIFPEGLLAKDSFISQMTDTEIFSEEEWQKVEIIGWLYQYYISEKKDQVFADLKKNIKINKDTLPAATQLFTPNWIVRYMVDNSLGRVWNESYPLTGLKTNTKYFLDEGEQNEDVLKQLEVIRYKDVNPEEITFLDPSCGSGHILVYAFDIFYEMYLEKGYMAHEIPKLILEKNLFGLDIDDRAVQLASFAVFMKAREKSRRVFDQNIKTNIFAIQESNWITEEVTELLLKGEESSDRYKIQSEILSNIRDTFLDAKEYGSILKVNTMDISFFEDRLSQLANEQVDLFGTLIKSELLDKLPGILSQIKLLSKKYDVVCTNPPYMGSGGMDKKLRSFTKKHYPNTGSDLSTIFMELSMSLTKPNGFISMINIPTWMYLSSYAEYRKGLLQNNTIINLLHLGRGVFGSDFGTVSFVIRNNKINNYIGRYKKFFEKKSSVESNEEKENKFFNTNDFFNKQENYYVIEGYPIAYNINEAIIKAFKKGQKINDISDPRQGLATGNNNFFLRNWYEINIKKAGFNISSTQEFFNSNKLYAPYNKGGGFRKWYGNCEFLIKFDKEHYETLSKVGNHLPSRQYYFKECLTWSKVTIGGFSMRYLPDGFVFDVSGCSLFSDKELTKVILAFMNSKVASLILSFLSPTVNYEVGHVKSIPLINIDSKEIIEDIVEQCIDISKNDWDNFETSWDFKTHPFIKYKKDTLLNSYMEWERVSNNQFLKLKENEERMNQILIENYKLQDILEPDVNDNEISINKADQIRDVKSFISYAIGCIFGRYSLDEEGLVYAGGEFEPSRYPTLNPDKDNVIPVLPGSYFEDDIISRLIEFIQRSFGEETLINNLDFIADTLGKKKGETAKETLRRYLLNDFYKDHVQIYKKRPIYWLFTSGKEKAFNCLIYMHRYDKTTLSRIRTDYLHEYQIRLDAEKKDLLSIIEGDYTTKEISNAKKELKTLDKKIEELKEYDELLHHMADMQIDIDLDDGVVVNYEKFKGLVAKI